MELAAALRALVPGLRAVWVGDGEMRPAVEQRIADLGLGSSVSITGWLDDVRPHVAAANLFVSVARYESFGYVTAEALAMERPVVASAITGTVDIVKSDVAEQLFTPNDLAGAAVLAARLLGDPAFAAGVANRGRAFVNAAFSVDETRRALRTAYDAALQPAS